MFNKDKLSSVIPHVESEEDKAYADFILPHVDKKIVFNRFRS